MIAYMLEPVDIGDRFSMWPLHMTLLPWFEAPSAQPVEQRLSEKLKGVASFKVVVGERAIFGSQLPVMLIDHTSVIQQLHEKLLEMLEENNWQLRGRYTGASFRPHVTQKAGQDASGTLHVTSLHIVEALPQNYRQIVGKVDLVT